MIVKSNLPGTTVALWERHPDHPGDGEVFVAGDREVEVAETAAVKAGLKDGKLVEVVKKATRRKKKADDDGSADE